MADALDLGSSPPYGGWGFESPPSHHQDTGRCVQAEHSFFFALLAESGLPDLDVFIDHVEDGAAVFLHDLLLGADNLLAANQRMGKYFVPKPPDVFGR